MSKPTLLILALLLLLPGAAIADAPPPPPPTVAFLRFGASPTFALADSGVLDILQAYGYISAEERAGLDGGSDLRGENINLLYRDANFDFATAALMVEDALDEGADVLITISNEVGLLAGNAIKDMDDPPALIFAIVTTPYSIGVAQASCVKPPYVGGTQMTLFSPQQRMLPFLQSPGLDKVGIIGSAADQSFQLVVRYLRRNAQQAGIEVEVATVTSAADMGPAAEQLVSAGADIIYLSPQTSQLTGVPALIEAAYGVPVSSYIATDVIDGVTIAGGFEGWYREGVNAGRLTVGVLRGEIDLANTAIASTREYVLAVNLQSAERQGVEISPALLEQAKYVIGVDEDPQTILEQMRLEQSPPDMTLEERIALDREFYDSLHCTPEMIAQQKEALAARR